ncbi:hypothetical protein TcWFU_008159 [Taenia crassiceps]|uniref:PIH1D1/2/3 CS-like domain-containing protein n=1 Tax=Taenia crassiceps TaxID=6207 RepID=A0ABR4QMJ6_9CEST
MHYKEETISIAVHPSVFEQYSFPRDEPNTAKQTLESDHLIALIILYLQSEKNIQTQEGNVMHERKNLPKFTTEWSSRPHGGDDLMLESLSCKKISLTDFATHLPIETKEGICAHPLASTSHVKNKSKLIEEIKPLPRWHLNRMRKNLNTYEYTIQLPAGTRMEDCELDISPLKGNRDFPDPFYAQFADPISPHKAKARFAKSTCRLSVVAPIGHSF